MTKTPASLSTLPPRPTWSLLAALALGVAPHAWHVPLWITALVVALFGWRTWLFWKHRKTPAQWILLLIAAGSIAGVFISYHRLLGQDPGVALLVIMLALKLFEFKTLRDAMVLMLIGYFLVITNFLYTQTIPMAIYLLATAWLITAAMIDFQFKQSRPRLAWSWRASAWMLVQALPLMAILFVLFPRIQGPLWGFQQNTNAGVSGLSDTMSPGSLDQLLLSNDIAFRVDFKGALPQTQQLYWRGPVMWDFDGRTWSAVRFMPLTFRSYIPNGDAVNYTITEEPNGHHWLFALDVPAFDVPRPSGAILTPDFQLLSVRPLNTRMRYDMTSYLSVRDAAPLNAVERARALRLPENANPRTHALAQTMRAQAPNDRAYIVSVLRMFHDNFRYTTTPALLGTNPVDEFLFDTHEGFCEHFASAFAVMMRAVGIPARVVTGYQGGEVNTLGNYLIVYQADAHAWTEVWLADSGWTRVDPTAAVAPARVEAGVAAAVPQGAELPTILRTDHPWLHRFRLTLDLMANTWNQMVLGYDQSRQRTLLRHFGFDNATWRDAASLMVVAAIAIVLALGLFALRELRTQRVDPVVAAYQRFCKKLEKAGVTRQPSEGPEDFCKRAIAETAATKPELANVIETITALYVRLRYANDSGGEEELRHLQHAVATLRA